MAVVSSRPGASAGAEAIVAWAEAQALVEMERPEQVDSVLHRALEAGLGQLPLPGSGETAERFSRLAAWGEADCVLARLIEAHSDAAAILAELGGPNPAPGRLWGVWAAEPPGSPPLRATLQGEVWGLEGEKPYCSGASLCDDALVSALAPEGRRLFAVDLRAGGSRSLPGGWMAAGMAGSDTAPVLFADAVALPVGAPGSYLERPGFWHGAVGVAACWFGAARGVARAMVAAAGAHELNPHALAHLGTADSCLAAMTAVLGQAATAIDAEPADRSGAARLRAQRVRSVVEQGASRVLEVTGRALGPGPLTQDRRHSRRVADLTIFLRQSHAERDLEAEARELLRRGADW